VTIPSCCPVTVNGSVESLPEGTSVDQVVARLSSSPDGIAVARNGDVVPRSQWSTTIVHGGDRLEILTAAAGG